MYDITGINTSVNDLTKLTIDIAKTSTELLDLVSSNKISEKIIDEVNKTFSKIVKLEKENNSMIKLIEKVNENIELLNKRNILWDLIWAHPILCTILGVIVISSGVILIKNYKSKEILTLSINTEITNINNNIINTKEEIMFLKKEIKDSSRKMMLESFIGSSAAILGWKIIIGLSRLIK